MFLSNIIRQLVIPVSLLVSTSALALECNNNADCPEDLIQLHQFAELGIPEAEVMMGFFYLEGIFVEKNDKQAFSWFKKGIENEQVNAYAHHMVGLYYLDGSVVKQDIIKGYEHIRISAAAGHAISQVMLGKLFYDDKDVPRDYNKARTWFEMAAEQSHPVGAYYAAKLAAVGAGGKKSISKAKKWYQIAAKQDYKDSRARLAKLDSSYQPEPIKVASTDKPAKLTDEELLKKSLAQIRILMIVDKSEYLDSDRKLNAMLYNGGRRYDHFRGTSLDFGFSDGTRRTPRITTDR